MRKILLGILAVCAIVLSSCDGNGVEMKHFQVEFTEIKPNTVSFTITPTDDVDKYIFYIMSRKEFDVYGQYAHAGDEWSTAYSGKVQFTYDVQAWGELYPASDYVLVAFPVVPIAEQTYHERSGKPEYLFFSTPDWPRIDEEGLTYIKNGLVWKWNEEGAKGITIKWEDAGTAEMYLCFTSKRYDGTFTKKDLFGYAYNYESYYRYNDKKKYPIYDVECTGIYDANLERYIYEGWFMISDSKFEKGQRNQFRFTCEQDVEW